LLDPKEYLFLPKRRSFILSIPLKKYVFIQTLLYREFLPKSNFQQRLKIASPIANIDSLWNPRNNGLFIFRTEHYQKLILCGNACEILLETIAQSDNCIFHGFKVCKNFWNTRCIWNSSVFMSWTWITFVITKITQWYNGSVQKSQYFDYFFNLT